MAIVRTMANDAAPLGSQTQIDPGIEARLSRFGRAMRWIAAGLGSVFGVATAMDWEQLVSLPNLDVDHGLSAPSAIFLLVLTIGSLLAGGASESTRHHVLWRRIGTWLSLSAAMVGMVFLIALIADIEWIWFSGVSGMPAFGTALGLLTLGVSVAFTVGRQEWHVVTGQLAALGSFSMAATILLGYLFEDPSVGRVITGTYASPQAVFVLLIASVGAFLIRPGSGLMAAASSPGIGGRLLRRMGLIVLITPAVLLAITESVSSAERRDVLAVVAVAMGLILLALLGLGVKMIDQMGVEKASALAQAERATISLAQEAPLVEGLSKTLHLVDVGPVDGWEVVTRFRPAGGLMAGDTSGVIVLPGGVIGVVLVDVTGHGVDPALRAVRIRDLLMHSLAFGVTLEDAISTLNRTFAADDLASAIAVRIDSHSGNAELAAAGHPPAIFTAPQETHLYGPTGPLLFLDPEAVFSVVEFKFEPGDAILIYSDGVADVQGISGGRPEPELLADMLLAEGGDAVRSAHLALGFADSEPADDQSVIAIRRAL